MGSERGACQKLSNDDKPADNGRERAAYGYREGVDVPRIWAVKSVCDALRKEQNIA